MINSYKVITGEYLALLPTNSPERSMIDYLKDLRSNKSPQLRVLGMVESCELYSIEGVHNSYSSHETLVLFEYVPESTTVTTVTATATTSKPIEDRELYFGMREYDRLGDECRSLRAMNSEAMASLPDELSLMMQMLLRACKEEIHNGY